ncbi:UNVERIFIED_CONTAM: hypothetical protein GTU68_029618 [Idotea baltica]|nr:hypothetical protein [Idotea baltica]
MLILWLRLPAFISLLVSSIAVGLMAGLSGVEVINTIKNGMGSTLGFVATVVGLGAMFGGILELSGGAKSIAQHLLKSFGEKRSGMSLGLTGFLVAIPVFFDVAFIILIPVIYALQKNTGKSLLHFAIPLLSGLAVTHSFIPPTPGPIAVAEILGANLGWVMLAGIIAGIPTMLLSGVVFGKYIGNKINLVAPDSDTEETQILNLPNFYKILLIIALPIFLIVLNTLTSSGFIPIESVQAKDIIGLIGHPFVALIIANLIAWYVLGRGGGFTTDQLLEVSGKSLKPAGIIILLTGAGGVFKQVLVDTNAGKMMAESLVSIGMPVIIFAFLAAALVRVVQGSATVAMITAAGLVFPFVNGVDYSGMELAAIVIAIASGASIFSHVNDSGFWLVKEYLGMTEKQTFRSWTVMTGILAFSGFLFSVLIFTLF